MNLKLVKATNEYQRQITEMLDEWYATGEKIIPYAIRRLDYHDFENYCVNLEVKDTERGLVPDSTFFCLDVDRDIMVGAVNIRHYLNDALLLNGGHMGDGVRPSERRKGIATKMIGLALQECKQLGIDKVLMVCDKENIGSAKSIMNNGGVLENEIVVDGVVEQRYWITLEKEKQMQFPYKKILIVGCGGAGKSTLARKMGEVFSLPVIHLDKLYWLPGWEHRTKEEFDQLLAVELKKSAWIIDGNYQRTFPERLRYADFCIFLDIDADICLQSAYARADEYRGKTRPDMAEGCEEIVRPDFEEWILTYNRDFRPKMLHILEESKVPYRIFSTRDEVEKWMEEFKL